MKSVVFEKASVYKLSEKERENKIKVKKFTQTNKQINKQTTPDHLFGMKVFIYLYIFKDYHYRDDFTSVGIKNKHVKQL